MYSVTYNTVSTGSLLGQGQASIAITNSSFTLTNMFDSTKAKFIFADLNIYDSASVVGQFIVYFAHLLYWQRHLYSGRVETSCKGQQQTTVPHAPTNPTMFSINGFNYVIDTNLTPHAITGNNNVSPLSTDVTVKSGQPIPYSTFTLNGLIYQYTEDASHNLLTITGTKAYMVARQALSFKLDSSLIFTINTVPPATGNYAGSIVPIGTITAGTLDLNLYAGTTESGGADFLMYRYPVPHFLNRGESTSPYRRRIPCTWPSRQQTSNNWPCLISTEQRTWSRTGRLLESARVRAPIPEPCGLRQQSPTSRRSSVWSTGSRYNRLTSLDRGRVYSNFK